MTMKAARTSRVRVPNTALSPHSAPKTCNLRTCDPVDFHGSLSLDQITRYEIRLRADSGEMRARRPVGTNTR